MRILIYGINYAPELTGIGRYTGEMAEWLAARGHDVRVVTAPPYYPHWRVAEGFRRFWFEHECRKGVSVWRCPLWVPGHPSGLTRIVHLASFAMSSFPVILLHALRRPDVVISIEPPLFLAPGAVVVSVLSRAKSWLHVQDFEVDAAFDLGVLKGRRLAGGVIAVERWLMRRFSRVSTISGRMLERLKDKGVAESKRISFPNWVDTRAIHPLAHPSAFRSELGLTDEDTVLLYSGNMGYKQGLDIIVEAAKELRDQPNLRFVMCGDGAAHSDLRARSEGLSNMTWLPLQPMERFNELLNLADIHLLPQQAGAADLVMPSKLTGIMASGRPVIATASEGTEVWSVVQSCGETVQPGDLEGFCRSIQKLSVERRLREQLGANARAYALQKLDRDVVLRQFEENLLSLVGDKCCA